VRQLSAAIVHEKTFELPRRTTDLAVHWRGGPRARVRVALSRDGRRFGRAQAVVLDEVGEQRPGHETYGAVMPAGRARAVRVFTRRPVGRLSVLAFVDQGRPGVLRQASPAGGLTQPAVISRAGWGADESLRYDRNGAEIWPPAFWPIQKLIVHHTATQNNDPDPAATVRAIYYYHAVTQRWGDIGYNFLIDEAGNVYEGRHSRGFAPGETPTGENIAGEGVTGAHAQGFNSGTVGIALLGTLTGRDATPPARSALEHLLAWKSFAHGIDPEGSGLYTNPVNGQQATFPNIAGHRDVGATECPGNAFYATLPAIRSDVTTLVDAASAYARPKGATPVRVSLGLAYRQCSSPNRGHGPPLASASCNPPRQASDHLTVGTLDANGQPANSIGSVSLFVVPGDPATPGDEADVSLTAGTSDVRNKADLSDYEGELEASFVIRITDRLNGASGSDPATVSDTPFRVVLPCARTADPGIGSSCAVQTTADAVIPGSIREGRRSIWELGQVQVYDGGADGVASTAGNGLFEDQALFVP
jgi:hypothetical protein